MATSVGSVHNSSDVVKYYACGACESKHIEESADYFCATCMTFFCEKCIYQHDQLYANHSKYGRGETNKWSLTKTVEDLLLKCDVHKEKKLKTFCQDHGQLCCTDCVLLNHRQCANVTLISDSVKKISVYMQQSSINLKTILDELNNFKTTQDGLIQCVDLLYCQNMKEIQDLRKKLNADLDALANTTLKELDKIRTTLQIFEKLKWAIHTHGSIYGRMKAVKKVSEVKVAPQYRLVAMEKQNKILEKLNILMGKLDQLLARPIRNSSPSPYRSQCFNCNELGHFKRDCPKLMVWVSTLMMLWFTCARLI